MKNLRRLAIAICTLLVFAMLPLAMPAHAETAQTATGTQKLIIPLDMETEDMGNMPMLRSFVPMYSRMSAPNDLWKLEKAIELQSKIKGYNLRYEDLGKLRISVYQYPDGKPQEHKMVDQATVEPLVGTYTYPKKFPVYVPNSYKVYKYYLEVESDGAYYDLANAEQIKGSRSSDYKKTVCSITFQQVLNTRVQYDWVDGGAQDRPDIQGFKLSGQEITVPKENDTKEYWGQVQKPDINQEADIYGKALSFNEDPGNVIQVNKKAKANGYALDYSWDAVHGGHVVLTKLLKVDYDPGEGQFSGKAKGEHFNKDLYYQADFSGDKEEGFLAQDVPELTAPEGKHFVKWNRSISWPATENVTVTAEYADNVIPADNTTGKPQGYTAVTFVVDAAKGTLDGQSTFYVYPGTSKSEITAPDVKPSTGYTFKEWDHALPETIGQDDITITATFNTLDAVIEAGDNVQKPAGYFDVQFTADADKASLKGPAHYYVKPGTNTDELTKPTVETVVGFNHIGWSPEVTGQVDNNLTFAATFETLNDVIPADEPGAVAPKGYLTLTFDIAGQDADKGRLEGSKKFFVKPGTAKALVAAPSVTANTGFKYTGWTPEIPETFIEDKNFVAQFSTYEDVIPANEGVERPAGYVEISYMINPLDASKGSFKPGSVTKYFVKPNADMKAAQAPEIDPAVGYAHKGWEPDLPKTAPTSDKSYAAVFSEIATILPADTGSQKPKGYLTVSFKSEDERKGSLEGGQSYFVKPGADLKEVIRKAPTVKANNGYQATGEWTAAPEARDGKVQEDTTLTMSFLKDDLTKATVEQKDKDSLNGTAPAGSTAVLYIGGKEVGDGVQVAENGEFTLSLPQNLAHDTQVQVMVKKDGSVSKISEAVVVDRQGPQLTNITSDSREDMAHYVVSFDITDDHPVDAKDVYIAVGGQNYTAEINENKGSIYLPKNSVASGSALTICAKDKFGNESTENLTLLSDADIEQYKPVDFEVRSPFARTKQISIMHVSANCTITAEIYRNNDLIETKEVTCNKQEERFPLQLSLNNALQQGDTVYVYTNKGEQNQSDPLIFQIKNSGRRR
ncbi:MAG: hypothetical protein E6Z06_04580 [Clostridiales bacterium]|nr:hypothetical protein [Clostridiales bacterium]